MHMPSKEYRQRLIEELVEKEFISTQAEIAEHLARRGIKVTQATISRDVNELRLVRLPAGPGQHRYRSTPLAAQEDVIGELTQRFRLFVRDLATGQVAWLDRTDLGKDADGEPRDAPSISGDGRYVAFVSRGRLVADAHPESLGLYRVENPLWTP